MTPTQSFEARTALATFAALASMLLPSVPAFFRGTPERFNRLLLAVFAASRFGLFTLIFLVLRIPARGDIPAYYFKEAEGILRHGLPYRDVPSSYAPLHPYLDGAALLAWHSPLAIIALAIGFECLAVFLWLRVAPAFSGETTRRTAALLYLASPLSLQFVTVDGQDNVILACALALTFYLLWRLKPVASGFALGLSIALVKFLPLLWVPPFFLALKTRWRWATGFAAATLLGYGFFALKRLDLLAPIKYESTVTSASNLPYVLGMLTGHTFAGRVYDLILLLALAAVFLWVARLARAADLPRRLYLLAWAVPLVTMLLVILSKKSWPNYLMLILFNLCLLPAFRSVWSRAGFALLQFLGCTAHSIWASFFMLAEAAPLHARLIAGDRLTLLLFSTQILLVALYLWVLWLVIRRLQRPQLAD